MCTHTSVKDILPQVEHALNDWFAHTPEKPPLKDLFVYRKAFKEHQFNPRQAINTVIYHAFQELDEIDDELGRTVRSFYLDGRSAKEVAAMLNLSVPSIHRRRKDGLVAVANLIYLRELDLCAERQQLLRRRLPQVRGHKLFGVDKQIDEVFNLLTDSNQPPLLALSGIGGIGKTTLADAVSVRSINENLFDDLVWVSAKQQFLRLDGKLETVSAPSLSPKALIQTAYEQLIAPLSQASGLSLDAMRNSVTDHLRHQTCLIVIDNLETAEDIQPLYPVLREWIRPSKILLTTRLLPYAEADIHQIRLTPLSFEDMSELVAYEARQRNLSHLAEISTEQLQLMYEIVGGNPLAIRLVVGQVHLYHLDEVLENLKEAQGATSTTLYYYIYHWAWSALDEQTRDVFLATPHLDQKHGGTLTYLAEICDLEISQIADAVGNLVQLNLIDYQQGAGSYRYTIHNLTRSFLHKEILGWTE